MEKIKTEIPFNYRTIKLTGGRIKKGLIAVPVSLVDFFPQNNSIKHITLINDDNREERRTFTPYNSSSHECRIGGLRNFFQMYGLKDGDEVVVIKLDDDRYRLIPENVFKKKLLEAFSLLEKSSDETESDSAIKSIKTISNETENIILQNEFVRLSGIESIPERKEIVRDTGKARESVPIFLRKILLALYNGRCQLTNYTFIMGNGKPYFEVHHIDPSKGNHPKNLLVVCPNIHAQFTHIDADHFFLIMINGCD
jgi:hypothetical protein